MGAACGRSTSVRSAASEDGMKKSGRLRSIGVGVVLMSVGAGVGGNEVKASAAAAPASQAAPAPAKPDPACPLTVEQVAAVAGMPMTRPPGGCTFFPANGRDVPHVFYVLQVPMVCSSIKPSELGFKEAVTGLPAREAYVADRIDGAHVLVCP